MTPLSPEEIDKRKAEIKKQLNEFYGSQSKKSLSDKMTDIYKRGLEQFKEKGYDQETAHNKTLAAMGIFVPEGYAIYFNAVGEKIEVARVH